MFWLISPAFATSPFAAAPTCRYTANAVDDGAAGNTDPPFPGYRSASPRAAGASTAPPTTPDLLVPGVGVGNIRIGEATVETVLSARGSTCTWRAPSGPDPGIERRCATETPPADVRQLVYPDLTFSFRAGRVDSIDVGPRAPKVLSAAGISVGSTREDLLLAYGSDCVRYPATEKRMEVIDWPAQGLSAWIVDARWVDAFKMTGGEAREGHARLLLVAPPSPEALRAPRRGTPIKDLTLEECLPIPAPKPVELPPPAPEDCDVKPKR